MEDCDTNHRENHRLATNQRQDSKRASHFTIENFLKPFFLFLLFFLDHLQKSHRQRQEYCRKRQNRGHG